MKTIKILAILYRTYKFKSFMHNSRSSRNTGPNIKIVRQGDFYIGGLRKQIDLLSFGNRKAQVCTKYNRAGVASTCEPELAEGELVTRDR